MIARVSIALVMMRGMPLLAFAAIAVALCLVPLIAGAIKAIIEHRRER